LLIKSGRNYAPFLAVNLLCSFAENLGKCIDEECLELIDSGLIELHEVLSYQWKRPARNIDEEDIPNLRFWCTCLSLKIRQHFSKTEMIGCDLWLRDSINDPLPEVRFLQ
jgi:hypothetical protein